MSLQNAYSLIKRARPIVQPNQGFMIQLQHYEKSLVARKGGQAQLPSGDAHTRANAQRQEFAKFYSQQNPPPPPPPPPPPSSVPLPPTPTPRSDHLHAASSGISQPHAVDRAHHAPQQPMVRTAPRAEAQGSSQGVPLAPPGSMRRVPSSAPARGGVPPPGLPGPGRLNPSGLAAPEAAQRRPRAPLVPVDATTHGRPSTSSSIRSPGPAGAGSLSQAGEAPRRPNGTPEKGPGPPRSRPPTASDGGQAFGVQPKAPNAGEGGSAESIQVLQMLLAASDPLGGEDDALGNVKHLTFVAPGKPTIVAKELTC